MTGSRLLAVPFDAPLPVICMSVYILYGNCARQCRIGGMDEMQKAAEAATLQFSFLYRASPLWSTRLAHVCMPVVSHMFNVMPRFTHFLQCGIGERP